MAWTYSDYITYERTDSTRLTRLRLHIKELKDYIQTGSYSVQGKSHTKAEILNDLARLYAEEKELSALATTTTDSPFLRGRGLA